MTSSLMLKDEYYVGLHITCKTLGSNGVGGMEDIRLKPYLQNLRFTSNDQNLRFIHNNLNIRFKRRRGRGGQKGVGGAEVSGRTRASLLLLV